jgi:hypothetical protein
VAALVVSAVGEEAAVDGSGVGCPSSSSTSVGILRIYTGRNEEVVVEE